MKNNSLKVVCFALGLWTFLLIAPTFVAAEEKDSDTSMSLGINILDENSQNAEVLDVEVNDLLGIDSIQVKIPNIDRNTEEITSISITDNDSGDIDAGILTSTETVLSKEQAVVDIAIKDVPSVNNVTVEVLNNEENSSDHFNSDESALVDVAVEDLIVTNNVDVELLKQEENSSDHSKSDESGLVDVAVEDLIVTNDVDVELLKQEENSSEHSKASESSLVDVALEDLMTTGDVDVELLKQEENSSDHSKSDESALVDVAVENLIVTDDVDVEVLKREENTSDHFMSDESALVDAAVEDLIVTDDVDVEVLKQEKNTSANDSFSNEGVVEATIEDLIIADHLELNIFTDDESESDQEQMELYQGIHLSLNDIPLLETLHVVVLEDQSIDQINNLKESSQLLTVGLGDAETFPTNSLLDEVELNLLENEQSWSDDSNEEKNAAVSLGFYDSNLGDFTVDVMLSEFVNSDDYISNNSGLVELNTEDLPLLEDIHLGILDRHEEIEGEGSYTSNGVLQLDILSDLTDEISADILANDEYVNEEGIYRNRQTIAIGVVNDILGETIIDILPTETFEALSSNPVTPIPGNESEEVVIENLDINEEEEGLSSKNNTLIPGTDNVNNDEDITTDNSVAQNDGNVDEGNALEELTPYPDEEIIVADGNESDSKDTMIENPTLTSDKESVTEEENVSGIGGNFNNTDDNFFTGSSLPQTGGFFTGMMLLIIALGLLGSGSAIRKLA
ncbi:hypothetical protein [Psychrobacillus psychrodurans]|uniref:LPXTG-motif cell wall anchor domain-containing protein n=1 Tax=Psychrobacillus psychrodurans TaxID=126157 RepID=A0A9X3RB92_9BACI|nr:hypothetical protein [Psychrobacillus psychrodurans]MCZ8533958.1 hypothetical protein [Psychrobacillus psychrodurans]